MEKNHNSTVTVTHHVAGGDIAEGGQGGAGGNECCHDGSKEDTENKLEIFLLCS